MIYLFYAIFGIIGLVFLAIINFKVQIAIFIAILVILIIIFKIYANIYFTSENFINLREGIQGYIYNCNELNHHIEELKGAYLNIKSYDFGNGTLKDNSNYNFKRKEWSNDIKNEYVYQCSASVCKNASNQPFKYLCKYFDIKKTEDTLTQIENVLNDFAAAEEGKILIQNEKKIIMSGINDSIPWIIATIFSKRLMNELGFEDVDLSDLYFPIYTFHYVSAGGNSSIKFDIKLDIENLEKFILYLKDLIKFRKSVIGQRALMTSELRGKIKKRDDYTCQICGLSIYDEENLLLEIDHIQPVSKGGITAEHNLQTLCWKCNRSKGSKIVNE